MIFEKKCNLQNFESLDFLAADSKNCFQILAQKLFAFTYR